MTEAKMSYLRGFNAQNDYRAIGAFLGSANPGFAVAAIFRDLFPASVPIVGLTTQSKVVCGNLKVAGGLYAGWNIEIVTTNLPSMAINFNYADSAGALKTLAYTLPTGIVTSQRTFVPQIFFGLTTVDEEGGDNDSAILALNGTVLSTFTGLNGYTPPGDDVPFIVGGTTVPGMGPATSVGFAGMSFSDQVCADPQSLNSYYEVVQLIADQWEDINADEDMRGDDFPIFDNLFSVRRGLPDVQDNKNLTWQATKGSVILTRGGMINAAGAPPVPATSLGFAQFFRSPVAGFGTIAVDTAVPFSSDGPAFGGIIRDGAADGRFILPAAGVYDISWMVSVDEPGQLAVFLDDGAGLLFVPETMSGRATGTNEITNRVLIETTTANALIEIRNHSSSAGALTMTPNPGGTSDGTTSLVITRLK